MKLKTAEIILLSAVAIIALAGFAEENETFLDSDAFGHEKCTVKVIADENIVVEKSYSPFEEGSFTKGTVLELYAYPKCESVKDKWYQNLRFQGWYDKNALLLSDNSTYRFTVNEDTTIYAASTGGWVVNNFYREKATWSLTSMGHTILKDHYTGKEVFRGDLSLFSGTNVDLECGRYDWYKSLFGLEMPMINNSEVFDGKYSKTFQWNFGGHEYSLSVSGLWSDIDKYIDTNKNRSPWSDSDRRSFVDYESLRPIASKLMSMCSSLPRDQQADFILKFLQNNVVYEFDWVYLGEGDKYTDYWKKPLQTLLEGCGDCEDQSVAACALFKACGFDTALLVFDSNLKGDPDTCHAVASVVLDHASKDCYYEKNGLKYYYCEAVSWFQNVGDGSYSYYKAGVNPSHFITI